MSGSDDENAEMFEMLVKEWKCHKGFGDYMTPHIRDGINKCHARGVKHRDVC